MGQILNPYPLHYKVAFACSSILYPLFHRLALRPPFPMGKHRAYHVPLEYLPGLGLAFLPVVLQLRQEKTKHLYLTTYLLVQAYQHLWLVSFDDIYQRFTSVDPTKSS